MGYSAQSLRQFATSTNNKRSEVIQLWTRGYSQRSWFKDCQAMQDRRPAGVQTLSEIYQFQQHKFSALWVFQCKWCETIFTRFLHLSPPQLKLFTPSNRSLFLQPPETDSCWQPWMSRLCISPSLKALESLSLYGKPYPLTRPTLHVIH